jgi:hypothetical protein
MGLFSKKEDMTMQYRALLERIESLEPKKTIEYDMAHEYYQWYIGNNLLEFYRNSDKSDYFWKQSSTKIKRVHSGLPRSIINILSIVTGVPEIEMEDEKVLELLEKHLEFNNFADYLKQEIRPRTLATGYGAIFPNYVDGNLVLEYVDARQCKIERVGNVILSASKITHYEKHYLEEKRAYNSIQYRLFDKKGNQVPLNIIRETYEIYQQALESQNLVGMTVIQEIPINAMTAVPLRYRAGNKVYGSSIFAGKLDLFDALDETMSRLATNTRKHSVNTYIQDHLIEKDVYGNKLVPDSYENNITVLRADYNQVKGGVNDGIKTEQAQITYDGLIIQKEEQIKDILAGIVSPSSIGYEFQRTPNAEAQREREKSTLFTRDDIIDNEISFVKKVCELVLKMDDFINKSSINDYEINVDYSDYASPTFNERVNVLLPLFTSRAISREKFVKALWGNVLSDEEVDEEVAKLVELNEFLEEDLRQQFTVDE